MRLIDADALEAKILMDVPGLLDGGSELTKAFILAMVKTKSVTPTVDAVPVIRCRDCAHFEIKDWWGDFNGVPVLASSDVPTCKKWGDGSMTKEDGFCFLGERRSE